MIRVLGQATALSLLLSLAACGGGGGGGGGNNGGGGGTPVTGISISPSTLTFTANHDDPNPPPPQTVTITALGSGTTYIRFENGTATGLQCNGTASCTYAVQPPQAPYTFGSPGSSTSSISFIGCADQFCNSGPVANGRQSVTYTYTVTPGLDVTPGPAINVNGIEHGSAAMQTLSLTNPSGTVRPWHASFTPSGGGTPIFATLSPSSGAGGASPQSISVQFADLPAGTYTGTIAITPDGTPRTVTRAVTYVVSSALSVGNGVNFVVDANTTSGALQQSLPITSSSGGVLQWSASETSAWLSLTQTSGDTLATPQIGVTLLPAALEKLPKGIHTADVTFTPPGYPTPPFAFSPVTLRVTLDMRLPSTDFALPNAVAAGATGEAYIRGSGFASLPGTVSFGNAAATSVTRVSDTLIRASHPALPSGSYSIDVGIASNALGLSRSRARLAVAGATYAATLVATAGPKYAAVFDDARQVLYVANVNAITPRVERLSWNGAGWTADDLVVQSLRDIALSPDGNELIALRSAGLFRINANAWGSVDLTDLPVNPPRPAARSLAVGHDGRWLISHADAGAVYSNIFYFDSFGGEFAEEFACCVGGPVRASGDGTAIFLRGTGNVLRYDVTTRTYTSGSVSTSGSSLSVSRDGTRFLVDGVGVYSSSFGSIGTLAAAEALAAGVIAPSGKRAYGYSLSGKLYTFDLETFNGSGGFAEIGTPIALGAPVGASPVMTTSADGATVFVAGSTHIAVQPGPP